MENNDMKKILAVIVIIGFSFSLPADLYSQVGLKKLGQSTMNFLKVGVSPRYAAMGNTATAVVNDARAMFYNPAGLAGIQSGMNAFVSNTSWIADINYTAGAVAISAGNLGTFGVSVLSVDYGDIAGAQLLSESDPQGFRETGNIDVGALAVGIGYARQISNQFSMGGEIQMVQQNLGSSDLASGTVDNVVTKPTLNFGIKFFPGFKSFRFAMSIRNFSSAATYEEVSAQLPLIFQVGLGMDLFDVFAPSRTGNNSLMLSTEFLHPNNYTERVNIGGEYLFSDLIAVRGGYEFNRDIAGLSAGFGLTPTLGNNRFELNYSYSAFDVFDGVNRFSLVAFF